MKTEKQITQEIKRIQKELKAMTKRPAVDFERYSARTGILSALQWVLRK